MGVVLDWYTGFVFYKMQGFCKDAVHENLKKKNEIPVFNYMRSINYVIKSSIISNIYHLSNWVTLLF